MDRRTLLLHGGKALAGLSILPFSSFVSPHALSPEPELPAGGVINLSSNENPYGPAPLARKAMIDTVSIGNRYQWAMISKLLAAIALKNNTTPGNVMIGAGSTEILDLIVQLAALKKGSFVVAEPTFSRWGNIAGHLGLQKIAVPLTADKHHDLPAMLHAIRPDTKLLYICNPNNPTGTICEHDALLSFIEQATKKTLVMVDEAYIEYAGGDSLSNVAVKNKNLIVVKTFSKIYGLAGSRVGYAIAHTDTIEQLGQLRCGANMGVSAVTLAGALASLEDTSFVSSSHALNEAARQFTIRELERLNIPCIPSHTNFIYFSLANYNKDFFAVLKENNIYGTEILEENGKWSRITVGTMQEMGQFIAAIK